MDAIKLHLLLNYYPAIALVIATLLLAGGYWRKNERLKSAALKVLIVTAVFTFAVYVTGEIAAATPGAYVGATAESLAQHKSFARPAFLLIEVTGIAALIGLVMMRRGSAKARGSVMATFALSLVTSCLVLTTVHFGRQVKWAAMPPADRGVTTNYTEK